MSDYVMLTMSVSTHSRPKAAGNINRDGRIHVAVSTHSRPKAAGYFFFDAYQDHLLFQHTAARRRLAIFF